MRLITVIAGRWPIPIKATSGIAHRSGGMPWKNCTMGRKNAPRLGRLPEARPTARPAVKPMQKPMPTLPSVMRILHPRETAGKEENRICG